MLYLRLSAVQWALFYKSNLYLIYGAHIFGACGRNTKLNPFSKAVTSKQEPNFLKCLHDVQLIFR